MTLSMLTSIHAGTLYGRCGDNATWTMDGNTLIFKGRGAAYGPHFERQPIIYEIIISEGIESVDGFGNYEYLHTVEIPNSVTSIGANAFNNCPSLENVKLPDSLITIGQSAFKDCRKLKSMKIPNTVVSIGNEAFAGCNLKDVVIGNSVASIGDEAFSGCPLIFVDIPNSVTSIGRRAFEGCPLTSVDIPNSVTYIGAGAFKNCLRLRYVKLPNSITSIESCTFCNTPLTSVKIPDSVTIIKEEAFKYCPLRSVVIPSSTIVAADAFSGRGRMKDLEGVNFVEAMGKCGDNVTWTIDGDGNLKIFGSGNMDNYTNYGAPWQPKLGYRMCPEPTSVEISDSVTSIGDYAFYKCSHLTNLKISNSVTSIGGAAFFGCSGLQSVEIPNSVTDVGILAFNECSNLTSVKMPCSVTNIGDGAFSECCNLTSIKIPDSVTSLKQKVFYGCAGLTSIEIPNTVTTIGDRAFCKSGLTSVKIPNSVTTIGICAFAGCEELAYVEIPPTTTVAENTFYSCNKLMSPIGGKTAGNCGYNVNWTLEDGHLTITGTGHMTDYNLLKGEVAPWKNQLVKTITIGDGVNSIGQQAFMECRDVTSVIIPNSVYEINSDAFYGCENLEDVVIPSSVSSIYYRAFKDCKKMTSVTIPNSVTFLADDAFEGCSCDPVAQFVAKKRKALAGTWRVKGGSCTITITLNSNGTFTGTASYKVNRLSVAPLTGIKTRYLGSASATIKGKWKPFANRSNQSFPYNSEGLSFIDVETHNVTASYKINGRTMNANGMSSKLTSAISSAFYENYAPVDNGYRQYQNGWTWLDNYLERVSVVHKTTPGKKSKTK